MITTIHGYRDTQPHEPYVETKRTTGKQTYLNKTMATKPTGT